MTTPRASPRRTSSSDDDTLTINTTIYNDSAQVAELKELIVALIDDMGVLTGKVSEVRTSLDAVVTAITTKDTAQDQHAADLQAEIDRLVAEGAVTTEQMATLQATLDQMTAEQAPVSEAIAAANVALDDVDTSLDAVAANQSA